MIPCELITPPLSVLLSVWMLCYSVFRCRDLGGKFLPFLLVSKGKKLIARLLSFLKRDAALNILRIVTSNLPMLMSKDTEEVSVCLHYSLKRFSTVPNNLNFFFK